MMLKHQLIKQMIDYFDGDVLRVNHALKVLGFASAIAGIEELDSPQLEIVEIAAILHDIGIVNAEKKYHSTAGNYQEIEGPPVAREMLKKYGLPEETIERICFLIGHHHSYTKIDGVDFQILVEADFLVNIFEEKMGAGAIRSVREKYFKTSAGKAFFDKLYQV